MRPTITPQLRDYGLIALTAVVIFVFVPAYMISHAPLNYAHLDPALLWGFAAVFVALYTALMSGAYWLAGRLVTKSPASHVVVFLFAWACCAGFLSPVVVRAGMVNASTMPTSWGGVAVVSLFSLAVTLLARTAMRRFVMIFLGVLIVATLLPATPALYTTFISAETRNNGPGISSLGTRDNVLVMSLDGLPGGLSQQVLQGDPALRARFKDFTVFENAVGT